MCVCVLTLEAIEYSRFPLAFSTFGVLGIMGYRSRVDRLSLGVPEEPVFDYRSKKLLGFQLRSQVDRQKLEMGKCIWVSYSLSNARQRSLWLFCLQSELRKRRVHCIAFESSHQLQYRVLASQSNIGGFDG